MYVRISWGRVNPGSWPQYEVAFKEGVDASGNVNGLVARTLCRDLDDPDTGYSLSWWESAEAMHAYEGAEAEAEILVRIKEFFGGAFVTNRLEIVMDRKFD